MKKIKLSTVNVTVKTLVIIFVILLTLVNENIKAEVTLSASETVIYINAKDAKLSNSNRTIKSTDDTPKLKSISLKSEYNLSQLNAKSTQASASKKIEYPNLIFVNKFNEASYSLHSNPYKIHSSSKYEKNYSIESDNLKMENLINNSPQVFSLYQNYPNPFNPETKISFNILKSAFVKLTVFDNLGKEVETLVNENLQSGLHKVSFNGSILSSGVYYYILDIDGFNEVKRMMLIK